MNPISLPSDSIFYAYFASPDLVLTRVFILKYKFTAALCVPSEWHLDRERC